MPKIKCAHCGANNQDVTEKDRCWQCDVLLGAPVGGADAATQTIPPPVQKQVEPTKSAPVQKQVDPALLPTSSPQKRFPVAPIAMVILLLSIVLAIVFFMLKK